MIYLSLTLELDGYVIERKDEPTLVLEGIRAHGHNVKALVDNAYVYRWTERGEEQFCLDGFSANHEAYFRKLLQLEIDELYDRLGAECGDARSEA